VGPLRVGVIANEFFDLRLGPGRMGGFGWAARQVGRIFQDPSRGVAVTYFTGELVGAPEGAETVVHGTRLVLRQPTLFGDFRRLRAAQPDVFLSIDYRPTYRWLFGACPRTPVIIWARDPRPPEDVATVNTLRVPCADDVLPKSAIQPDCRCLARIVRTSRRRGRSLLFAGTSPHLRDKVAGMIGTPPETFTLLPNPVDVEPGAAPRHPRPRVLFLARLDPYKRPWLAVELARRFPDVEFILAGKAHYQGVGAWTPTDLPPNVQLVGHVDGVAKARLLASSWVLLNTSIHEGLAVSFLEALACQTPLLACVDPGGVVSRFGLAAGRFDGNGLAGLPALEAALRRLLAEPSLRHEAGARGRAWVAATHNREAFLTAFFRLCRAAGVRGVDSRLAKVCV
jgi:glycosyltransferase involved in cell wall biosynthesis